MTSDWGKTSRVHQLGRMHLLDLIAICDDLLSGTRFLHTVSHIPPLGWNRDHLITLIREMEDPALPRSRRRAA